MEDQDKYGLENMFKKRKIPDLNQAKEGVAKDQLTK